MSKELIAVIDVETTGLAPWRHDRVIEIAGVLTDTDGTTIDEFETLVNPERDLGPTHIHRISADEVIRAPKFADIAGDVVEFLSKSSLVAGHNISFDWRFIKCEYSRLEIELPSIPLVCTYQILGRSNLRACCAECGIEFEGEPHHALTDARAAAKLVAWAARSGAIDLDEYRDVLPIWPDITVNGSAFVSRTKARAQNAAPPAFLERMLSKLRHDTDAPTPNLLTYLTILDRVLEDRVVDESEAELLVDAATDFSLSARQVTHAHRNYLHNLAVHALADGVVSEAERLDLHRVARLLGLEESSLDAVLSTAAKQLQRSCQAPRDGSSANELIGKTVCFTGALLAQIDGQPITRSTAEALAEKAGLKPVGSVTRKLDVLVVADPNTQSGKAKKARQYGTRIVAENVFWKLLDVSVE